MMQTVLSQFYPADFPVSQSVYADTKNEAKTRAGCGTIITGLSPKHSQIGLLLRIVQDCTLYQSSQGLKATWKQQDMKWGISVFRLQAWAHRMSEKERLLFVTNYPAIDEHYLPTPCASDSVRIKTSTADYNRESPNLPAIASVLSENLSTPLASTSLTIKKPSPSEYPGGSRRGRNLLAELGDRVNSLIGRRIHPNFVEWMMGFPLEWTNPECKLSAMQLCQECSIQSSEPLEKSKQENKNEMQ